MQNNNSEIFSVKKYSMKQDKIKKLTGNIKYICDIVLSKNKGYHLKLLNDNNVILFGDIDHVENEEIFIKIKDAICEYFNLAVVHYTKSIKEHPIYETEYSYHWSFNGLFSSLQNIKLYIEDFKIKHPQFNKYIDISVYSNNRLFRLPNQTNKDKPFIHNIIEGQMFCFILDFVHKESEKMEEFKKEITNDKVVNCESIKNDDINIEILNCLKCLDINDFNDYEEWRKIGLAIPNILNRSDEGFEMLNDWSSGGENYDFEKVKKFYYNVKNNKDGLKIGTLKKLAKEHNLDLYNELFQKQKNNVDENKLN
jgi:hypothetical protein